MLRYTFEQKCKTYNLTHLSMNVITKEYISSVKINLQNRSNVTTSELVSTFKDPILVKFYPLGIRDCLIRNNSSDDKN